MQNKTLYLYLLKKSTKTYLCFSGIILIIIFFSDCSEVIRKCSVQEITFSLELTKISFYRAFAIYSEIIQYILLLSNALTFMRLNQSEELTILRTNGFNIFKILKPVIWLSLFLGISNLCILQPVSLQMTKKSNLLEHKFFGRPIESNSQNSNIWVEQKIKGQDVLIYINSIAKDNTLNKINIYYFNKTNSVEKHIHAKKAVIQNNRWILNEVTISEHNSPIKKQNELAWESKISIQDLSEYYINPSTLNIKQLIKILNVRKNLGITYYTYEFCINFLLLKIFIMILVTLFSIIFCFEHHRYSIKWINIICIIGFGFLLNLMLNTIKSIGITKDISPIITCWIPILIAFGCVIVGIYKVEKKY